VLNSTAFITLLSIGGVAVFFFPFFFLMSSQAHSRLLSVFFDNPSIETKMKKKNKTFP
jgi:hypothetical protein